jgi:hypothetical protein
MDMAQKYAWKNAVRDPCKHICVVTLTQANKHQRGFACHHLNSVDLFPEQVHLVENGVYLTREVHKQFHNLYGYGKNTESQFADFCQKHYHFEWDKRKKQFFGNDNHQPSLS